MKFVIWGVGKLGKVAYEFLKKYEVACFVDSNIKLQGSLYDGVQIISPDVFSRSEWKKYPVIVTPKYHEEEIFTWLKKHNINWFFSFMNEYSRIIAYTMQIPEGYVISLINSKKGYKKVYLYGMSIMALLLLEDLKKNNVHCQLLINYDLNSCNIDSSIILLTTKPADEYYSLFKSLSLITYDFYNITMHKTLYRKPLLEQFKNIHKGESCFIIGNGPSLQIEDLQTLHDKGFICFGVNGIIKAFNATSFRPDYYCMSDIYSYLLLKDELNKSSEWAKALFFTDSVCSLSDIYKHKNWYQCHLFVNGDKEIAFSDDFSSGVFWGYTVIYDICLQLASYMGFSKIYLLGCDCSFAKDGAHHFINNYENDNGKTASTPLIFDKVIRSYYVAKQYTETHDIKIYNATRGGKLEVFPRVDFDEIMTRR